MRFRTTIAVTALAAAAAFVAGCSAEQPREVATAYVPDPMAGTVPWARYADRDDDTIARLATPAAAPTLALARTEALGLIDPGAADLEALAPARIGAAALGAPLAIRREAFATVGPEVTRAELRRAAARLGAARFIVARFEGRGAQRRLVATLHETTSGREVARYGPGEPSLSLAGTALATQLGRTRP